jgi:hypothetical protein
MELSPKAIVFFGLMVALALLILMKSGSTSFPVPEANGYDDFLNASAILRGYLDDTYSDRQALENFVSENAEAYALVRAGLKKSSRVTILTTRDEISSGGLALDYLNGIACKALVLQWFRALIPNLTLTQRSEALRVIELIESRAEEAQVVDRRTLDWANSTFGPRNRIDRWGKAVQEMVQSRSFQGLGLSRRQLLGRREVYEKEYLIPILDELQSLEVLLRNTEAAPPVG